MQSASIESRLLSVGQVARQLNVSTQWVRMLIHNGEILAERTSIGFLIYPESLERYVLRRQEQERFRMR